MTAERHDDTPPAWPNCDRWYVDEDGYLVEVLPETVLEEMQSVIDNPPPVDQQSVRRLAALLRRARSD